MKYNKAWLKETYPQTDTIPFYFFYGHQPSKDGHITKSCFSQWWVSPFEVEGHTYKTAEHWMMAGKAVLFGDNESLAKILQAGTPAQAKRLGRLVANFDPPTWDQHKFELVVKGNSYKFKRYPELREFLSGTGERVLVEASPVDRVWGIGLAADKPAARNPEQWKGDNLLGFALMEVREMLK
jgi:ribA/ribD-fused uncharacterized protein